ncbi:MAG: phosphoribosylaminoimidazolesuccinocarboxamide synthase [Candidatus Aminicenantaceae bacterium]
MDKTYSEISIPELTLFKKGKVRDIFEMENSLLFVASDRISAFDWVLPSLIPDKGKILTQLSVFWFEFTSDLCPNHVLTAEFDEFPSLLQKYRDRLEKRSLLVRKTEVLPVECVVRGYLEGSGWKDYLATGETSGVKLPMGLKQADKLDEVIFTPATKADEGHDMNISFEEMQDLVGGEMGQKVKEISVSIYKKVSEYAYSKGIIIADTKFEFGIRDGGIVLIDEIFTPDSSRFWPVASYSPGMSQPSLDKQFVRNYLEGLDWDKNSPAPELPSEIIARTAEIYLDIFKRLTGKNEL